MAGPEENVQETIDKPCRACTDFNTWAKLKKTGHDEPMNDTSIETEKLNYENCPLTRDSLGRQTWGLLHTMAAYYPDNPTDEQKNEVNQFMKLFSRLYPCSDCAEDLQRQIERFPPKTDSQHEFSQWLCRVHNRINLKLGKPLFDCKTVNERWRDGWKDGSCD